MNVVQRYTWEDALIEAERIGVLAAGAVNTGLRLARQINWEPSGKRAGQPSGLYWDNELAAETVSVSRATLFRNIKVLKEAGFLLEKNGNLLPAIPQSQNETFMKFAELQQESIEAYNNRKSQSETTQSQDETPQSQSDNPYSEDTYTEDECSEDKETAGDSFSSNKESSTSSSNQELNANWEVEEEPQSHNETVKRPVGLSLADKRLRRIEQYQAKKKAAQ